MVVFSIREIWGSCLQRGGWKWLERLGGRSTQAILKECLDLNILTEERREAERLLILNGVIKIATEDVPFIRNQIGKYESFSRIGDLRTFPITTNADLRKSPESFIADGLRGEPGRSVSGGSTGTPVTSFSDPGASSVVKAAMLEGRAWWNIYPWSRCLGIWGHSKYLGGGWKGRLKLAKQRLLDAIANRRVIPAYDLSEAAARKFHRAWIRDRPRYIVGYASALYEIARLHSKHGLTIPNHDTLIISTGEVLHEWQAEVIEDVMGCRVIEEYGLVEAGAVAYSDPEGEGLRVIDSHFIVELLDDEGEPVAQGVEGRIVVTSLRREGVPVVRYDTGDRSICLDSRGGQDVKVMSKVIGRTYDIIRAADGTAVPGVIFTHAMKGFSKIERFQVVQRMLGAVELLYTAPEPLSQIEKKEIVRKILTSTGSNLDIGVDRVEDLPCTGSGKYRWIRSELKI